MERQGEKINQESATSAHSQSGAHFFFFLKISDFTISSSFLDAFRFLFPLWTSPMRSRFSTLSLSASRTLPYPLIVPIKKGSQCGTMAGTLSRPPRHLTSHHSATNFILHTPVVSTCLARCPQPTPSPHHPTSHPCPHFSAFQIPRSSRISWSSICPRTLVRAGPSFQQPACLTLPF